jgi:hypothetical protein
MTEYFNYWPEDHLRPLRKNKRSAEHPFEIEIEPGLSFKGIIDEVDRTPDGQKWLTDHKTFTKIPNEDHRWRNIQSSVYLRAIEMLGWWDNMAGTCWNYVKSKPPSRPELLKSGALSEKSIDSLPITVRATIKKLGLKTKDYPKLISAAEANRSKFFFRIFTPVTTRVVDNIFNGFVETAREVAEYHGTKSDMNIDRHCDYCDYETLCRAKLCNSDVDFIKEREYYVDETKKPEDDNEEAVE